SSSLLTPVAGSGAILLARSRSQMNAVVALAAGVSLGCMLLVVDGVLADGPSSWFSGLLYVDALSALLILVVTLVGFASLLYSIDYLGKSGSPHEAAVPRLRRYYVLLLLFLFTMYLVSEANNLALLWIGLEGTTLVSALMVGYYQTRRAVEASWKYLILCSAGLSFALFGTLLLYLASVRALGTSGSGLDWTSLVAAGGQLDPGLMQLAVVFLFVGFATKAGLAPLHTWLPDAHSDGPDPGLRPALRGAAELRDVRPPPRRR
ncbi:hydrogenase 4 subunit F, partial [mine drainage metagenome]